MTDTVRVQIRETLTARALELVTDATMRSYRDDVIKAIAEGLYDGQSPLDVARALRKRFDAHEYDWQRLARSEIAQAQAMGIERYDWVAAGGSCPICIGLAQGGPYSVSEPKLPVRDSHPNCRCGTAAVIED